MTRLDDIKARAAAAPKVHDYPGFCHGCGAQQKRHLNSRDDIDWLIARVEELSAALREQLYGADDGDEGRAWDRHDTLLTRLEDAE